MEYTRISFALLVIAALFGSLKNTVNTKKILKCGISKYASDQYDCSKHIICNDENNAVALNYCPYGTLFDYNAQKCKPAERYSRCPKTSIIGRACSRIGKFNRQKGLACIHHRIQCASLKHRYWSTKQKRCVQCPDGWVYFSKSCYYVSNETAIWSSARMKCIQHDSTLAVINNQNEFNFIINLTALPNKYFWVGLNDLEKTLDFVWEDGRHLNQYNPWFPAGQPQQALKDGNNGCVNTDSLNGVLNNWRCDDPSNYICELSNFVFYFYF